MGKNNKRKLAMEGADVLANADPRNNGDDLEHRLREARAKEVEDAAGYRRKFFWWGIVLTSVCVAASIGALIFLTIRGVYETALGVAFVSGLAVEVVGLAAIIAKYLFPAGGAGANNGGKTGHDESV